MLDELGFDPQRLRPRRHRRGRRRRDDVGGQGAGRGRAPLPRGGRALRAVLGARRLLRRSVACARGSNRARRAARASVRVAARACARLRRRSPCARRGGSPPRDTAPPRRAGRPAASASASQCVGVELEVVRRLLRARQLPAQAPPPQPDRLCVRVPVRARPAIPSESRCRLPVPSPRCARNRPPRRFAPARAGRARGRLAAPADALPLNCAVQLERLACRDLRGGRLTGLELELCLLLGAAGDVEVGAEFADQSPACLDVRPPGREIALHRAVASPHDERERLRHSRQRPRSVARSSRGYPLSRAGSPNTP